MGRYGYGALRAYPWEHPVLEDTSLGRTFSEHVIRVILPQRFLAGVVASRQPRGYLPKPGDSFGLRTETPRRD